MSLRSTHFTRTRILNMEGKTPQKAVRKNGRWREVSGSLLGRDLASFLVFAQAVICRGEKQHSAVADGEQG